MNFDILAWHVDARRGQRGFSPHRDRQPEDAKSSFRDKTAGELNQTPKYATCWIALSDATPENGCLYAIPKDQDPGFLFLRQNRGLSVLTQVEG